MIATFRIKNFRSILDMTVDFRFAEGKAPNGYKHWDTLPFLEATNKVRLIPCMALFGANASGKTNIIRGMDVFRDAVLNKAIDFYEPNKLHDDADSTIFDLTFYIEGDKFTFFIEYNGDEIRKEELTVNGQCLYVIRGNRGEFSEGIRSENYSTEKLQAILDVECSDGNGRQVFTFLTRVGQNYTGLNVELWRVFIYIDKLILIAPHNYVSLKDAVKNLAKITKQSADQALVDIVEMVRRLDIDIQGIRMQQEEKTLQAGMDDETSIGRKKAEQVIRFESQHVNIHQKSVFFDFINEESTGTRRLAGLVGMFLFALKGGHTVFIDELDCSLHSLLLRELIRLFKDNRYNATGAQLVFTTHNTDILDDAILRVSEVAIVRKTLSAGTMIKRIVEFKEDGRDVRNVTNFRKQYLDGFYSGVPHPAI